MSPSPDVAELPARWAATLEAAGAGRDAGAAAAAGRRLLDAYAEEHRGYHDLLHLSEVLGHVDHLAAGVSGADMTAVQLAAWYHDAIYDGLPDMEQRSAALAAAELHQLGVQGGRVAEVARLVRLTATHDVADGDAAGALLCDADLAILGSGPDRYAAYAAGVRLEYGAYDEATFAAGRLEVLRRLLDRPALYRTPAAAERWERPARHNLETEMLLLSASGGA